VPRYQVRVVIPSMPAAEVVSVDVEAANSRRAWESALEIWRKDPTLQFPNDSIGHVHRYSVDGTPERRAALSVELKGPVPSRLEPPPERTW
jgi:hypothetical protein